MLGSVLDMSILRGRETAPSGLQRLIDEVLEDLVERRTAGGAVDGHMEVAVQFEIAHEVWRIADPGPRLEQRADEKDVLDQRAEQNFPATCLVDDLGPCPVTAQGEPPLICRLNPAYILDPISRSTP